MREAAPCSMRTEDITTKLALSRASQLEVSYRVSSTVGSNCSERAGRRPTSRNVQHLHLPPTAGQGRVGVLVACTLYVDCPQLRAAAPHWIYPINGLDTHLI